MSVPRPGAEPFPAPPPALERLGPGPAVAFFGPGAIIATATIGTGELVWGSRAGAVFGYSLLWCFFYAGIFKVLQVYSAARHLTLTGEHPIHAWRELPGPRLWLVLVVAVPALLIMPIAFSGISEILATYVHRLAGLPLDGDPRGPYGHLEAWTNLWATVALVATLGLALGSSYAALERASTAVLLLKLLGVAAAVVIAGPALRALLTGMLVPGVPDFAPWLLSDPRYVAFQGRSPWLEVSVYFTAVGGGAYDYIGYIAMMREKGWGRGGLPTLSRAELAASVEGNAPEAREQRRRARVWLRAPLLDISVSFAFVIGITMLFAILGAEILHGRHDVPDNSQLLSVQERFLTTIHPSLVWLYRLGVFAALGGVLYGAYPVYRATFAECFAAIFPAASGAARRQVLGRAVVTYCFVGGLVMVWLPAGIAGDVVARVTFGSLLSGAASCGLWCLAMLWVDRTRLPPALRMSMPLRAALAVAGVAMLAIGVQSIAAYLR
jgi:hypothetical protein